MKKVFYIVVLLLFVSCNTNKQFVHAKKVNYKVSNDLKKSWYHKDIVKDSIPGISLERAYQELIKNKKGKEVVAAVIDTQMDINHEDLKQAIWLNKDEIPNNNIDDDNNGYIDDINGWNFIGNSKGESVYNSNMEFVRIMRMYDTIFTNKNQLLNKKEIRAYLLAKEQYTKAREKSLDDLEFMIVHKKRFKLIKQSLKKYFPNKKYSVEKLRAIKTKDSVFQKNIKLMIAYVERGFLDKWIDRQIDIAQKDQSYYSNLDYNDRQLIGDNENDITNTNYGYHNVLVNPKFKVYHATYVAGTLGAIRNNNIGIDGISNNIKIMPLVISSNGDENDKDVALAIRYAVDNGAKVISMSFAKEFSVYPEWVQDALKYAAKNNVLCVHASGNESVNIDKVDNYPEDYDANTRLEIVNNFIEVGASTYHKNIFSDFSNYGQKNVDIFAPGEDIYTTRLNNEYKFKSGTSMATPIVSGIAALVMSYYPKLKASEVKEIILASGVSYDMDVEIKGEDGKKKLVPFKSLSKSGKIVNAYNALLLAKHYKQWKKGKWKM